MAGVRFLARGDRSAGEVERYLAVRGYAASVVTATLRALRRQGYLNDEAVALRLAQRWMARKPLAREALAARLQARALPAEAVSRAVRDVYEGMTEEMVAAQVLNSVPARAVEERRDLRRRAARLQARGFSAALIEALLAAQAVSEE